MVYEIHKKTRVELIRDWEFNLEEWLSCRGGQEWCQADEQAFRVLSSELKCATAAWYREKVGSGGASLVALAKETDEALISLHKAKARHDLSVFHSSIENGSFFEKIDRDTPSLGYMLWGFTLMNFRGAETAESPKEFDFNRLASRGGEAGPEKDETPQWVKHLVEVATYVGAAALGGVIGNRTDAGVVVSARKIFMSVVSRWRSRRSVANDDALTEDEARDVAYAAVLTLPWIAESTVLTVADSERSGDGVWRVSILYRQENLDVGKLLVRVGSGDPLQAKILIIEC